MTAWLLTWLWQGVTLAVGVAVALRCARRLNAATKHFIWCCILAALAWLGWNSSPYRVLHPAEIPGTHAIDVPSAPDIFISIFLGVWTAIALLALLRLLPSLHAVYAMRDRCRPFPPQIEAALPLWLEAKARGRRTALMLCDVVPGATVLGFQRPCIAIPPALVEGLTVGDLDQVILHEYAHVQRRDDWSRLAQTLLMSVLWIHPAALFASRALNREREMACDEWVVARTGLPKVYARCLAHAAEVRGRVRSGPSLVPAFISGRHDLVRRVDRLLAMNGATRRNISLVGATAGACAMVLVSTQMQTVRFVEIADMVLPHVAGPMTYVYNEASKAIAEAPFTVRRKPDATREVVRASIAPNAPIALNAPNAPIAPTAPNTPSAPIAPILEGRTFAGAYALPGAAVPSDDRPNPWRAAAAPGVEIASVAKRTSLSLANVFSRAGVSLARSF
jgi:beta-lactamase regulating signal transducer with metallopeptidase domain